MNWKLTRSKPYQYALVCCNKRNILVDQLSTDFEALTYDYLRLLPEIDNRIILCHNLAASERRKLSQALSVREDSINILKVSTLEQLDESDLTLPRTLEISEAMREIDLVDSVNQIVFFGFIGFIAAIFVFSQIDSFLLDVEDDATSIESIAPRTVDLSAIEMLPPSTVVRSVLLSLFPMLGKDLYVLKQFKWAGGRSYEITVDADAKLSSRAKDALENLGYDIVSELGTGQWEGTASYILRTPFIVSSTKIGDFEVRKFHSRDSEVQSILDDMEQLTGREWIYKVAEFLDGEVAERGEQKNIAIHDGKEVSRLSFELQFRELDLLALENLAKVLEARETDVNNLLFEFDLSKGVFHTSISVDVFDYKL